MNEKIELAKKALNLSNEEWQDLGEQARTIILQMTDTIKLEDPKANDSRSKLAQGIREILALHNDQYNALPAYQREILLKKINDL